MSSPLQILYLVDEPFEARARSVATRLDAALGTSSTETVVLDADSSPVEGRLETVDAVVVDSADGDRLADLLRRVRKRAPETPVVHFGPCDGSSPGFEYGTDGGSDAAPAVRVEFVQRKNEASVGVLVETLGDLLDRRLADADRAASGASERSSGVVTPDANDADGAGSTDGAGDGDDSERVTGTQQRYEAVMETVGDGIYALDAEDRFVAVNDAYLEMTGYSRAELLGAAASTVTGDPLAADIERIRSTLEDDTEAVVTLRTDLPTKAGGAVPIEARVTRFPLGNGEYGRVGVVRDVTERQRLEAELREVFGRITDAVFGLDENWEFTYVNDRAEELLRRSEGELLGESVWDEFPEAVGSAFEAEYERAMERQEQVTFEEYYPPLDTWFEVSAYPSASGLSVYFRDVTEARRRSERLEALNERFDRLPDAETASEVCATVVEAADEALGLTYSYVALYDEAEGELEIAAQSAEAASVVDSVLLGDARESPVWTAFVRDEPMVVEDYGEATDGPAVGSVAVFPLGTHGVFVALDPEPNAFDDADALFAEMLSTTARASLDRAAREADLRVRGDALEAKNERLERLNRVNRATRDITGVLLQADSHESIEELVCERLVDIDPYVFAWVGHVDWTADEVVAATSAGESDGYLDEVVVPLDDPGQMGPIARAVDSGEPQVQNDILTGEGFGPWREAALSRGFRSAVTVPLQHRGTLHGVLTLYAGKPGVFEEMETAVLAELGETIGYAMNAIDRKQALVGEGSTELKFAVPTDDVPLFGFLRGTDGRFVLENAVHLLDGRTNLFFDAEGVDGDRVLDAALDSPEVQHARILSERDREENGESPGCSFMCTVGNAGFLSDLLERGALLESIAVESKRATFTICIPRSADARVFLDYFGRAFGEVDFLARRELSDPVMTDRQFENEVRSRLTERQEEVIRTAYLAGFFEWPRESNGQEVAEILGVTQPTVNRHIRAGERTLFGLLFGER